MQVPQADAVGQPRGDQPGDRPVGATVEVERGEALDLGGGPVVVVDTADLPTPFHGHQQHQRIGGPVGKGRVEAGAVQVAVFDGPRLVEIAGRPLPARQLGPRPAGWKVHRSLCSPSVRARRIAVAVTRWSRPSARWRPWPTPAHTGPALAPLPVASSKVTTVPAAVTSGPSSPNATIRTGNARTVGDDRTAKSTATPPTAPCAG